MTYDPRTVFAAAMTWWRRQPESKRDFATMAEARHAIRLRIHVIGDETGCFLLRGAPKTYWEPAAGDGFRNTDRTLADETLGHVVLSGQVTREERFWPTWQAFAEQMGLSQAEVQ